MQLKTILGTYYGIHFHKNIEETVFQHLSSHQSYRSLAKENSTLTAGESTIISNKSASAQYRHIICVKEMSFETYLDADPEDIILITEPHEMLKKYRSHPTGVSKITEIYNHLINELQLGGRLSADIYLGWAVIPIKTN